MASVEDVHYTVYTVEDAIEACGFGPFQYLLTIYAGLAWFADSLEVMLLSFMGPAVRCYWDLDASRESYLGSAVFGGMIVGACCWDLLSDVVGRARTFLGSAICIACFGVLSAFAPSFWALLCCRFMVGAGLAGAPVAITLLSEFLPAAHRRFWLLAVEVFWTLGALSETALAWRVLRDANWQLLLLLSAAPTLLLLALYPFVLESPQFLAEAGRWAEAEAVLKRVAAFNGKTLPTGRLGPGAARIAAVAAVAAAQDGGGAAAPTRAQRSSPNTSAHHYVQLASPSGSDKAPAVAVAMPRSSPETSGHHYLQLSSPSGSDKGPTTAVAMQQNSPEIAGHHYVQLVSPSGSDKQATAAVAMTALTHDEVHIHATAGNGFLAADQPTASVVPHSEAMTLRRVLRGIGAVVTQLFGRQLRLMTALLILIWWANALVYYGVVMLTTQLYMPEAQVSCNGRNVNMTDDGFLAVMITSAAELPSLAVAAVAASRFGLHGTITASLGATGACIVPLLAGPSAHVSTTLLFGARFFIMAGFSMLWVLTVELYPTQVRTTGLGLCNLAGRVGGFAAPLVAVYMVETGHQVAAEGVLAVGAFAAAVALLCLRTKHVPGSHSSGAGSQAKSWSEHPADAESHETAPLMPPAAALSVSTQDI